MIPFAGFATVWMFNQWAHKSAWKQRKCANVSICRLCNSLVVSSIFMQQEYFLALNLSSSGCSQVVWLFTNKIKNRRKVCWWCNIINIVMTFLPHMPTLFVSQTQTATQNGSTHGCVFTTYNQFSTITNWKQVVTGSVFFIPFLLRGFFVLGPVLTCEKGLLLSLSHSPPFPCCLSTTVSSTTRKRLQSWAAMDLWSNNID